MSCAAPGVRIEGRAHRQEGAGDRDRRHGDRGGDRIDAPRVDADEADGVGILGGGADRAPEQRRLRKTWMPPSSAIATAKVSAASLPIAMSSVSDQLS